MTFDCVVVGAGPAGLAAATLLAEQGASVAVLDEQAAPGGQIWRGIEAAGPRLRAVLGDDYAAGAAVVARFRGSGATYYPGSSVWNVTPEREVWFSRDGRSTRLEGRSLVVATGAMERPVPLPGWELPGVMGAGAVQILLKSSGLVPENLILVGSGPLLYLLAAQCIAAGARPAAVLDTARRERFWAAASMLAVAASGAGPRMLAKGLMLQGALRAHGVPWYRGVEAVRFDGSTHLQAVHFSSGGQARMLPASMVALHEGVIPTQHVSRALGCAHVWDGEQASFRPVLDRFGATSVAGVLVAGDAGAIGGAQAALHSGRIAAAAVLHGLGRIDAAGRDRLAGPDLRARADELAIRPFLDRRYAPPGAVLVPEDGTLVCRCEEVTAGALRAAVAQGCQGPNQAKAFTRVGMGPCQGRICGTAVTSVLAAALGRSPDETGHFRIRPPLKPISLGELAGV